MADRTPLQRAPISHHSPDLMIFRALMDDNPNISVDLRVRVAEYQSPRCWDIRSGVLVDSSKWLSYILRHGLPSRTYPEFNNLPMRPDGLFPLHLLWDAPVATLCSKCHNDIIRCYIWPSRQIQKGGSSWYLKRRPPSWLPTTSSGKYTHNNRRGTWKTTRCTMAMLT